MFVYDYIFKKHRVGKYISFYFKVQGMTAFKTTGKSLLVQKYQGHRY